MDFLEKWTENDSNSETKLYLDFLRQSSMIIKPSINLFTTISKWIATELVQRKLTKCIAKRWLYNRMKKSLLLLPVYT